MFRYIDRLRKRPIAERRQAANTITVAAILIVAALWLLYTLMWGRMTVSSSENEPARVPSGVIQGPYENVQ